MGFVARRNDEGQCGLVGRLRTDPLAYVFATLLSDCSNTQRLELQRWTDDLVRSIEQWRHREMRRREGQNTASMFGKNGGGL